MCLGRNRKRGGERERERETDRQTVRGERGGGEARDGHGLGWM